MTIQEQIDSDIKEAMRSKEAERLSVLRLAKSAIMNAAIAKYGAGNPLPNEETIAVLQKQVKQRQDSIESFIKGNREELAEKERKEIEILADYLPKMLSETELETLVKEAITEVNATSKTQMGQVMKAATTKAAGRAEGRVLSQIVQKLLS
jgi:uncharacterized protein